MSDLSHYTIEELMDELDKRKGLQYVCIWRHKAEDFPDEDGDMRLNFDARLSDIVDAWGLIRLFDNGDRKDFNENQRNGD